MNDPTTQTIIYLIGVGIVALVGITLLNYVKLAALCKTSQLLWAWVEKLDKTSDDHGQRITILEVKRGDTVHLKKVEKKG